MKTSEVCVGLYDHYESIEQISHYYGVLAILGLVRAAEAFSDAPLLKRCIGILKEFPDGISHGHYNFPSYRIGGNPRAYALMRGYIPEDKALVREYAEELMSAPRDPKGILKLPSAPEKELIWIDVATAATPYLLYAGLAMNEERYIDEAVFQVAAMYDEFIDKSNGLLHQSKNFNGPGNYSRDHWSRGNGWGFFALSELLRYLPEESKHRAKVLKYFCEHARALLPHQSGRGLWRQEIPLASSYEESSGTALILYGYGVGLRMKALDGHIFRHAYEKGINGLYGACVNSDFSTNHSCEGCLCPGGEGYEKGSVEAYINLALPGRDEHHSFGPFILAFAEAAENGILEL